MTPKQTMLLEIWLCDSGISPKAALWCASPERKYRITAINLSLCLSLFFFFYFNFSIKRKLILNPVPEVAK